MGTSFGPWLEGGGGGGGSFAGCNSRTGFVSTFGEMRGKWLAEVHS